MSLKINITKEQIENLFIKQHLSVKEISLSYNCSNVTILNWIRKFGFEYAIKIGYPKGRKNPKVSGKLSPTKRPEVKQKMRDNHCDCRGDKNPNYGATWMLAERNPNWKGGITSFNKLLRNSEKYNQWRLKVYAKAGYKCKYCKEIGRNLHAHHIVSWAMLIKEFLEKHNDLSIIDNKNQLIELAYKDEILWNVNNGITYCGKCHSEEHPSMNYIVK